MTQLRALSVTASGELTTIHRRLSERLRESFLVIPALLSIAGIALAYIMRQIDQQLLVKPDSGPWWEGSISGASAVAATIGTSMLTFLAVVFSITLVAVQLASQQFSPRVVRTFSRSSITKVALGTFMATFLYALLVQNYLGTKSPSSPQVIPVASITVGMVLVGLSLAVFIVFVSALLRLIRLPYMLSTVARETRQAIEENYPPVERYSLVDEIDLAEPDAVITYDRPPGWAILAPHAHQGVLQGMDTVGLVRLAWQHGCALRLVPRLGEYVAQGEAVVAVYGPRSPNRARVLRNFDVGRERTLYQDPAYGFRQLVDIGVQALSPAVNAPTTAVQVVDRLGSLLRLIASRPDPTGIYADRDGVVRLIVPVTSWSTLVELTFTELRTYSKGAPQVTRRLLAALNDLLEAVPDERRPPLERQREALCAVVEDSVSTAAGQKVALSPDRLGLG
jgi:uncharacterized membrane protein